MLRLHGARHARNAVVRGASAASCNGVSAAAALAAHWRPCAAAAAATATAGTLPHVRRAIVAHSFTNHGAASASCYAVRGFATFRTRGSSRVGRNSSRNSHQYDDDADDGGEEREVGLDAVRDEQGRRIIDPMGAALNSSSSNSRRRGGWRGDEEQQDGGEVDVDEERANDALMRQLAERNNRSPSAGSRAQVADAAFLRQQAAAQQARVEEAQRSGAPASQQQHQPQRDEWAFDEDVGISDDYGSVSKPRSSSRGGRGGSVVPFPEDGDGGFDDGSSAEATSYLPASSATYQAQRQRKREMQREQERRAEQQRMRDPAAEAYRPYRPYNEHRADAFASPNDVGSPSSSAATPQRPKYTSSRASPAQLAWQKQQQLQREQGGNDQWSAPATSPPQQQQQQQQQQAEDMHEEARAASRRDQLAARDQSARAKYAARHGLGAAVAVSSPPAASSPAGAAASSAATTTSSTPVTPVASSSFSSPSHSAVSEQPMRSVAQREAQRSAEREVEEENWSIPQPSDWEHAIPDPDRDQALRRERKMEKLQRNRDRFLDGEEGDFIEPRPRPPREEREHRGDGWSQGGRGGNNSRFPSRGGGSSFGRPQHTERDGDFVAAHDADGFRERVTYSPRRGGGDAARVPQRDNREEFSGFSASTRPSGPVKGQMRTVSGRKARREEAEALAAQRLSEPREQDIPRPDGLRGATAAERYAATSIAATFRSGASSRTTAAVTPPVRLGGSSSAARDPTAAPTTRPWSRQVQDLMKSRGATFHGELLYGVHPVLCALQADRRPNFHHLYLQDNKAARLSGRLSGQPPTDLAAQEAIVTLARAKGVGISYLSKHDLHLLSDGRPHNGFALDVDPIRLPVVHAAHDLEREFEALRQKKKQQLQQQHPVQEEASEAEKRQVWVLLDEVMDPQNLGAMLRSCLYFSVDGVLLCARNSAPLSATTSKASSGAQEFLPLYEASATPRLLHKLDRAKWNVVGLSLAPESVDMRDLAKTVADNANNAANAADSAPSNSVLADAAQDAAAESVAEGAEPLAVAASSSSFPTPSSSSYSGPKHVLFVVGNEGRGLRPVVARACDVLVKIVGHGGSGASSSSSNAMAEIEDDTQRANADALAAAAERVNAEDEADEAAANTHVHVPHSSFSNQPKFGRANERGAASTRVLAAGDPRAMVDSLNVSNALAVALYELSR